MLRSLQILIFLLISPLALWAQTGAGANTAAQPTFHMTGDVALNSNAIRRGLTYTDQDPNLQGSFWFNFGPQFRLGLWGSNVALPNESVHFNLHLNGDIKVVFSPNADLTIRYTDERFFDATSREGQITGLVLNTFGVRTTYEMISNWEGTGESANYYNFSYDWTLSGNWKLETGLGYSQTNADSIGSFFDTLILAKYKGGQILWTAGGSYTSSDVFSRGGLQFVVGAKTEF